MCTQMSKCVHRAIQEEGHDHSIRSWAEVEALRIPLVSTASCRLTVRFRAGSIHRPSEISTPHASGKLPVKSVAPVRFTFPIPNSQGGHEQAKEQAETL